MVSFGFGRAATLVLLGASLLVAPAAPRAQEVDTSFLPIYREYRDKLITQGWRPDANFGLKLASGRPLYRFPEVLCGPKICHARWLRSGAERVVTLIRGDLDEEYRVSE